MTGTEHPFIKDGWFMEKNRMWPGQAMSLEVSSILHTEKSQYQDILIFESKTYGTVLVLDGVIQVTERDEFSYQEMIAHLPLFSHPKPENVLIVGGGDGGVAREVLKHPSVKRVVLCEIDQRVIELSKQYLPSLAISFKDPRVEVHIMDGAKFLESRKDSFDVVITDSSDPVGPAEKLFQLPYFQAIKDSLRDGGVMASQGECLWLHLDLIAPIMRACKQLFSVVEYAYTTIPTYPSGQIGFILCRKSGEASIRDPLRRPSEEQQKSLKYYNTDLHRAVFILPEFARRALSKG